MQNTKRIVTLLLVLPILFWSLVKPVALHANVQQKQTQSSHTKDKKVPQQVVSEQSAFHNVPTPSFDFPSNFEFKSVFTVEFLFLQQPVKSFFSFARNKIFTILFTQYISTLAP